jgi:hypothetical protein
VAELLFRNSVQSITGLERDRLGRFLPFRIYRRRSARRRKDSWFLRPQEKMLRRYAEATATFANEYLRLHEKSARQKNGFLRDLEENLQRAYRKAIRKFSN